MQLVRLTGNFLVFLLLITCHLNVIPRTCVKGSTGVPSFRDDMANRSNKYEDNAAGSFFVDNECIDCMVCQDVAPDNFVRNDKRGYSYVFNQPSSPEQESLCREAQEACPVSAIGSDLDQ